METVGAATWDHSLRSLRPGGIVVIAARPAARTPTSTELNRIFFLQLRVVGSTMGTRDELGAAGQLPRRDRHQAARSTASLPMTEAREGFAAMASGDVFGKVVFTR